MAGNWHLTLNSKFQKKGMGKLAVVDTRDNLYINFISDPPFTRKFRPRPGNFRTRKERGLIENNGDNPMPADFFKNNEHWVEYRKFLSENEYSIVINDNLAGRCIYSSVSKEKGSSWDRKIVGSLESQDYDALLGFFQTRYTQLPTEIVKDIQNNIELPYWAYEERWTLRHEIELVDWDEFQSYIGGSILDRIIKSIGVNRKLSEKGKQQYSTAFSEIGF